MKHDFAFARINFILLAVSMCIVILGYVLMSGPGSTHEEFNESIFDFRHTTLAPITCLAGYLLMIVAILYRPKEQQGMARTGNETKKD